jgi:hypothetical protein
MIDESVHMKILIVIITRLMYYTARSEVVMGKIEH